jgi:hypothetical protein
MAFPTSPTNGQTVVVNNVSYQYSNVSNSWTRILSTANIITANTVVSNGYISAAGNILTGNYFIGNGSQLTGITLNPGNISNGTSNVTIVSSGGNATVNIGGTSNIAVFATTGEYVTGIVSASGNIISAANVTGGNILTGGLISVTGTLSVSGVTTLANLSAGNISSGGITSGGAVSAAGNITGGNLSGTNIAGTLTTASQTNITSVGTLGSLAVTANVTGGNLLTGGLVSAAGTITGTSHLGAVVSVTANVTGGNILTGGLISATGTITSAANITGGNILTGGLASVTGNITGGNLLTAGIVSSTGNIVSAGNIIASKIVSATDNMIVTSTGGEGGQIILGWTGIGNITGQANSTWNLDVDSSNNWRAFYQNAAGAAQVLITANSTSNIVSFPQSAGVSASGNVTGGNVLTVGQISATGNITGNFYIGNGAFLTGLSAGTADQIANGATSIAIPVSSGNIAMSVTGQSNTVVINLGSLTMYGTFAGPKTLSANVAVADAVNALLLGPVTLGNGFNISVPNSSTLYVYAP